MRCKGSNPQAQITSRKTPLPPALFQHGKDHGVQKQVFIAAVELSQYWSIIIGLLVVNLQRVADRLGCQKAAIDGTGPNSLIRFGSSNPKPEMQVPQSVSIFPSRAIATQYFVNIFATDTRYSGFDDYRGLFRLERMGKICRYGMNFQFIDEITIFQGMEKNVAFFAPRFAADRETVGSKKFG